jgi:hypothetical protein
MTSCRIAAFVRPAAHALTTATLFAFASAASAAPPLSSFVPIGDVSNYSNPGVWEHHQIDVTALVSGAIDAQLSFDFANDLAGTGSTSTNLPTNAHLYFAGDSAGFYLNFEYFFVPATPTAPFGNASSHLRDVRLTVDGATFDDQYAAFAVHRGDPLYGTAGDGDGPGYNILGQTGFDARTYVLSSRCRRR